MKRNIAVGLLLLVSATSPLFGQTALSTTEVDWSNNASFLLRDMSGAVLTQGSAALNNDGALVQLGYFSTGTAANNFSGTWIPLTGATAVGRTTIGDSPDLSGSGDGVLAFDTVFHFNSSTPVVFENDGGAGTYPTSSSVTITASAPANGQVLAIRFFDSNSGTSGKYNTVSADNWTWQTPTDLGAMVLVNLATSTLEWEDPTNAFKTSLTVVPIPEPSTYALIGLGALGMMGLRRRIKR